MNTYWGILSCIRIVKYPRIRGEHGDIYTGNEAEAEVPPHTRGTRCKCICGYCGTVDHPRLRGEHLILSSFTFLPSGSPPLTRGTHQISRMKDCKSRITPAYAGNTILCTHKRLLSQDHPSLRGEHSIFAKSDNCGLGSPPLTRGTHG